MRERAKFGRVMVLASVRLAMVAAVLMTGMMAAGPSARAQGIYSDTGSVSNQQRAILRSLSTFSVLRFIADPGPLGTEVVSRMQPRMVRLFLEGFPGMPVGDVDTAARDAFARQGRVFCSYLGVAATESDMIGFAVRCELGNIQVNAAHRRSVRIVRRDQVRDAVEEETRLHLATLGQFLRDVQAGLR